MTVLFSPPPYWHHHLSISWSQHVDDRLDWGAAREEEQPQNEESALCTYASEMVYVLCALSIFILFTPCPCLTLPMLCMLFQGGWHSEIVFPGSHFS